MSVYNSDKSFAQVLIENPELQKFSWTPTNVSEVRGYDPTKEMHGIDKTFEVAIEDRAIVPMYNITWESNSTNILVTLETSETFMIIHALFTNKQQKV